METFVNHSITHKKSAHVACNEFVLNHVFADIHFQCTKTNVQLQIQRRSEHMLVAFKLQQNEFERCPLTPLQQHRCLAIPMVSTHRDLNTASKLHSNSRCFLSLWCQHIVIHTNKLFFDLLDSRNHRRLDSQAMQMFKSCSKSLICALHHRLVKLFLSFSENPS